MAHPVPGHPKRVRPLSNRHLVREKPLVLKAVHNPLQPGFHRAMETPRHSQVVNIHVMSLPISNDMSIDTRSFKDGRCLSITHEGRMRVGQRFLGNIGDHILAEKQTP